MHIILELALSGIRKTHIMYRANLSHQQLNKFLDLICNHQLLRRDMTLYMTTARGRAFIKSFHEIQEILDETTQHHVPSLLPDI
ncbi:MAG: winged helix-turn-helix domain-containing protein [Candidatus Kariarchaeaceae archaeon]